MLPSVPSLAGKSLGRIWDPSAHTEVYRRRGPLRSWQLAGVPSWQLHVGFRGARRILVDAGLSTLVDHEMLADIFSDDTVFLLRCTLVSLNSMDTKE
jgi:hypothetical protein